MEDSVGYAFADLNAFHVCCELGLRKLRGAESRAAAMIIPPFHEEFMDRYHPDYVEAIRYLYERLNYEKTTDRPYTQQHFRLARMEALLTALGEPQTAAPVVHIAGTKGKGSVAWFIAESLRLSGYHVGLYTSPHLEHIEERFVVDGEPILPAELVETVELLRSKMQNWNEEEFGQPTFFELTTAVAWLHFQKKQTDINIIEVGLGGRLDSTNVCNSLLSVITTISLDHQAQLGNTLSAIASEKAGIIKPGNVVIHGVRPSEAQEVIHAVATEMDCQILGIGVDFDGSAVSESVFDFLPIPTESKRLNPLHQIHLKMLGWHQAENASVAIATCQTLNRMGWGIPDSALRAALAGTQVPSRIEVLHSQPSITLDAAHNEASISSLLETLEVHFPHRRRTVVFASSKDKEYDKMLLRIASFADRLIVTQYSSNPRFVPVEHLEALAKGMTCDYPNLEVYSAPNARVAVDFACQDAGSEDLLCFTGSFFLAAEVRPLLIERFAGRPSPTEGS